MKISVVIPLYNKRETIARTLQSVFSQILQPEEILVVNDGSTDGSEQEVIALNHPLIKLIHQSNVGVSAARNRGIEASSNDWIAFLDADDVWMPEFLETIQFLSLTYPKCQVLATAYKLQDQNGESKNIILKKIPFKGEHGLLSNYFEVAACSHPPVNSSSIVVKKTTIQSIGGFPIGVKSGEDLLTWAKLMTKFEIAYFLKPLSIFIQDAAYSYYDKPNRLPEESDSVGEEMIVLAKSHFGMPGIRHYVSHWYKMRASIYLRLGIKRKALTASSRSLYYNPMNWKLYVYFLLLIADKSIIDYFFRKFGNS